MTLEHVRSPYAPSPSVWEQLKRDIKLAAPSLGIDDIGFATADPFVSLKSILQNHRDKGYESGFEEPDLDKRVTPVLPSSQPASLISIAVAYPSKMVNPPKSEPGAYRGILARSAWGRDYHYVLREAMQKLEDFIRERIPEAVLESMVDTGALVDRAVAERAGIGFSAKNCMIISPKWGSWIYLGDMVTNIPFPPDTPVTEDCGDCTKCIDACPTGALVGPGQLDAQRCVSFLTQTKGLLEEEQMRKIGNRLYGCDTCQIVCPKNRGKSWDHNKQLLPDPEITKPLLLPILDLTNREFKEKFGESAAAWRGKKPMQRNAIIALGNFKDRSAVPRLEEVLLKDPRFEMRGTAAWALGRIGGEEALNSVNKGLAVEEDVKVQEMLMKAKEKLEPSTSIEEEHSQEIIYYDEITTPIGVLTLCTSVKGICLIEMDSFTTKEAVIQQWSRNWAQDAEFIHDGERLSEAKTQLEQYFAGERKQFDLPIDMRGTLFQLQVWTTLADIPYGETCSYGQLAEAIERPKAVKAVQGATNKNPIPIIVPCHRIIGADNSLAGYVYGHEIRSQLLSFEGSLPER
ncbi:tRNA epoxyqueuosine(34) reductase QueG [Paenibacillus macquariensis]|uniref:Epoxyqueuosine reductase n=1 Tax=Paenibacillus macquariensis TaxID=948756 RepID=A0ABY1K8K3_9BACL|nr:tRNA epoxyqueuosine(34) reductase QueG [Paenibacillus macquariensis]MEC0093285.1 tRNA epoxyqueuosine(34) reductase QueG [Paenibacillus macquariensis]OAB27553.1 epoxyqueuosine reductase [Paenibacillus macquariensis subsp. macquariensis]SIR41317.1 epoxyqueuosine reductase [Paenibacillus macquariensis]